MTIEQGEATCIWCDCTDSNACEGGCSWVLVDLEGGLGLCSRCAEELMREKELALQEGT